MRVRPVAGARAKSYVERLATANHLKAGFLWSYLCEPALHRGPLSWDRLAAVSGREPANLREIIDRTQCIGCGKIAFLQDTNRFRQICSPACRQKAYRRRKPRPRKQQTTECQICGKKLALASRGDKFRRWCSQACRQKGHQQRQREQAAALAEALTIPEPTCDACEAPLGRGSRRRWCSRRCINWAYTCRRIDRGETPWPTRAPDSALGRQEATCPVCSSLMEKGPANKIRVTCSPACRNRLYRLRKKNEPTAITRAERIDDIGISATVA